MNKHDHSDLPQGDPHAPHAERLEKMAQRPFSFRPEGVGISFDEGQKDVEALRAGAACLRRAGPQTEDQDLGAGLIHQAIPDMEGTLPRPTFTEDQVVAALRNSGVDVECGACMEVAFTGVTTNQHTCKTRTLTDEDGNCFKVDDDGITITG